MNLFFRVYGQGPPLIILHGLFGLSDNWVTIGKKLASQYTVYIPDLRNHGQSPHSPVFDFPSLEDDLLGFIEKHDLVKPVIIGHSLGGKTAMFFALHQPDHVSKLVIVDISLRRYPHNTDHQELINAMLTVDMDSAQSRSDVERQLESLVRSPKLRQFLMKSVYWKESDHLGWRLNVKAINENLHAVFEGVDITGEYTGPALFIRGGLSTYVSDDDIILIKKKFPAAVVRTIPMATHWVHADAPGEFYEILSEFLDCG
jgi:pimeloyl-ACP methyl ester carboxylesterase